MVNFTQVGNGVNTQPLLAQVLGQPHLWDKNPCRLSKHGPHHESNDIFLRSNDETPMLADKALWSTYVRKHTSVWYQSIDLLPAAKPLIYGVMLGAQAEQLGGVYIYKLKPGCKIHPHIDTGWHPDYYTKFNICLQSNPQAAFVYYDELLVQQAGDVHNFRNDVTHSVINEGVTDHIIMTVCVRTDDGYRCPWSPEGWSLDKQIRGE
jgi:hypothetical protein